VIHQTKAVQLRTLHSVHGNRRGTWCDDVVCMCCYTHVLTVMQTMLVQTSLYPPAGTICMVMYVRELPLSSGNQKWQTSLPSSSSVSVPRAIPKLWLKPRSHSASWKTSAATRSVSAFLQTLEASIPTRNTCSVIAVFTCTFAISKCTAVSHRACFFSLILMPA
jgi:hypothetical protein